MGYSMPTTCLPTAAIAVPVGPLAILVDATGGLGFDATEPLLRGYSEPASRANRRELHVQLRLGGGASREVGGAGRYVPVGHEAYVSRCPGWYVEMSGLGPDRRIEAHAQVLDAEVPPSLRPRVCVALLRSLAATAVVLEQAVLLHGCAMVSSVAREAVVFIGPSGSGKTTMLERLPGWSALADDIVCVELDGGGGRPWVCGTPFAGKERHPRSGERHRLAGVVALVPGADCLALEALPVGDAFRELLERIIWVVEGPELTTRMMAILDEIVRRVPVWRLSSGLAHSVAEAAERVAASG